MRPRTPITSEQIIRALAYSQGNVEVAAELLRAEGVEVSGRTLRRRMADYGIKARTRYELDAA